MKMEFGKAYAIRFDAKDIDEKPIGGGAKLSYLNWAVAWRSFRETYPEGKAWVEETPDGSPLWIVNGYGFVKCGVEADGLKWVEVFPIMDNRNEAIKAENIDARDVNDSIQRGLTKAIARLGIGLYIYEGKADEGEKRPQSAPKALQSPFAGQARQQEAPTQQQPAVSPYGPSQRQLDYIAKSMAAKGITEQQVWAATGKDPKKPQTKSDASQIIDWLIAYKEPEEPLPTDVLKEVSEDDLPF